MTDEPEAAPDPVRQIENALAELDPSSLVVGFATVVEWLEEDGSRSMSLVKTPMAPWHLHGLLTYARDHHALPVEYMVEEWADDDEGDF